MPTILVADDEPVVRGLLSAYLRGLGYSTLEAEDGLQAVELYRQRGGEIAAAILDLNMPGLSGQEVITALRAINPSVRCCLMTGSLPDILEPAEATCLLAKPFGREQFVAAIEKLAAGATE